MARIKVGLELNNEGRAIAWALDYPGCFAYGDEGPQAIIGLAPALVHYQQWVNRHAEQPLLDLGNFDLRMVDTWTVFTMNDAYEETEDGYAVDAWFKHDWKPLSDEEIERGLHLLRWSRSDLLELVASLSQEQWDENHPGERWSIRGILRHVANVDWWYLDRLDLAAGPRDGLPTDLFARLAAGRAQLEAVLPGLVGKEQVLGKQGEFWSPRKLLRRALWHEIDHREHIRKLKSGR